MAGATAPAFFFGLGLRFEPRRGNEPGNDLGRAGLLLFAGV